MSLWILLVAVTLGGFDHRGDSLMQWLDEFPLLQRSSPFKSYHNMDLHRVDKLPLSWQDYIVKKIKVLRKNITTCIKE